MGEAVAGLDERVASSDSTSRSSRGGRAAAPHRRIHAAGPELLTEVDMKVAQAMSRDVCVADPNQSICQVACTMGQIDAGAIPVGENDRLIGMITDRDIAVRAVAAGKRPDTP